MTKPQRNKFKKI